MARILDLTGETFGKLKVLCRTVQPQDSSRGGTWWLCECVCGRQEVLNGADLRENRRKQCRNCKEESRNMTGQEHGTWLVIRTATEDETPDAKSSRKTTWWKVRCIHCGKEAIRSRDNLRKGHKQCSCVGVPKPPRPLVIRQPDNKVTTPIPISSRKCKQCGKIFELETFGRWGWTIGEHYFCTYKCMRAYEKAAKGKKYKTRGLKR